jgi:hypothetical protein
MLVDLLQEKCYSMCTVKLQYFNQSRIVSGKEGKILWPQNALHVN